MRKILILGAGQAGLILANGLRERSYEVTILAGQATGEIRDSWPSLTEFTMPRAQEIERQLKLDRWSVEAPPLRGIRFPMYVPGLPVPIVVEGRFEGQGSAVDPRVKMSDWLEYFEDVQGGRVTVNNATLDTVDYFTRSGMYDLVIVSSGADHLRDLFELDSERFGGAHPRVITQAIVHDFQDSDSGPDHIEVISSPAGRIVMAPTLTGKGFAHSLMVMDSPGGVMDGSPLISQARHGRPSAVETTEWIKKTIIDHDPAFTDRVARIEPVDDKSVVVQRLTPQVRHPIAELPSGGLLLGTTDVVMDTDPISGQGWNLATFCAMHYLGRILAHGDQPFTREWMAETFEGFYQLHGVHSATLSHMLSGLWDNPLPEYFNDIITATQTTPAVADRFVNGINDPADYTRWFYDEAQARAYLDQVRPASD